MTNEEPLLDDESLDVELDLMLTTVDNPYNPRTDYDKWKVWDEDHKYYTESYIARLMDMEEELDLDDEARLEELRKKVILDILEHDVLNIYTLV